MTLIIDRLKLIFLGVFALACAGAWAYQIFVVGPAKRCEAAGNWWDPEGLECATPIDLRSFPRIATPPPHRSAPTAAPTTAPTSPPAATPAH